MDPARPLLRQRWQLSGLRERPEREQHEQQLAVEAGRSDGAGRMEVDDLFGHLFSTWIAYDDVAIEAVPKEVTTETKYCYLGSQRVAMQQGNDFSYLHSDHLGSTVMETNLSGAVITDQKYYAYGSQRDSGPVSTDHKFTGQKLDGSGLMYYNARYYDPTIGQFVSPDTLVPDPENVLAYNRYMYALGNPLRYTDSSGRCIDGLTTIPCVIALAALAGGTANMAGNVGGQVYENWDGERSTLENLTDVNGTETAIAFGFGAAGGALAPVTGGITAIAINSGLGALQEVTTDMIVDGESLSKAVDSETAVAGALGAAGGLLQNKIPDELFYAASNGERLGIATGEDAVAYGGQWFAGVT